MLDMKSEANFKNMDLQGVSGQFIQTSETALKV